MYARAYSYILISLLHCLINNLHIFYRRRDNEITFLVNGVDEVTSEDIDLAKSQLEQASAKLENAQTDKEKIEASINLKRVSSRIKAMAFL